MRTYIDRPLLNYLMLMKLRFYTLAAQPDLVPLLRDDIQQALSKTKGEFSTAALQDMKKLDSFIKEVSRFYPLTAGTDHLLLLENSGLGR